MNWKNVEMDNKKDRLREERIKERMLQDKLIMKKHKKITFIQAYEVMLEYFKEFYIRIGKPDNLASFLGEIQLKNDRGITMDPAAWVDWVKIAERVIAKEGKVEPSGQNFSDKE